MNREMPDNLNMVHLNSIFDLEEATGYSASYLLDIIRNTHKYYFTFQIKKKGVSRGKRIINSPTTDLKIIQQWILTNILEFNEVSLFAKAYKKKTTLVENVKFHRNQEVVLKIDFENFFSTLHIKHVISFFKTIGYSSQISFMLARLCTLNESLPQGAVTSPALSNLLLKDFDNVVFNYSRDNKIRFTRYADDLTFSGTKEDLVPSDVISFVRKNASSLGLKINGKKTKILFSNARQIVTGIVVNEKLQIPSLKRKKIRQEIYFIKKYGIQSHLKYMGIAVKTTQDSEFYLRSLLGRISFGLSINNKDVELQEYYSYVLSIIRELE